MEKSIKNDPLITFLPLSVNTVYTPTRVKSHDQCHDHMSFVEGGVF